MIQQEITRLLQQWNGGDPSAVDKLTPLVYDELRRIARRILSAENPGNSLQATALVHEMYLRLTEGEALELQNRAHLFGLAATLMRRILVDHARARRRSKRGGGKRVLSLDDVAAVSKDRVEELLIIDTALQRLAKIDERKAHVVEMRFFGGLSVEETAAALKISENTVIRDWALAKAWLQRELESGAAE